MKKLKESDITRYRRMQREAFEASQIVKTSALESFYRYEDTITGDFGDGLDFPPEEEFTMTRFTQSYTGTYGQRYCYSWEGGFAEMEKAVRRALANKVYGITYTLIHE